MWSFLDDDATLMGERHVDFEGTWNIINHKQTNPEQNICAYNLLQACAGACECMNCDCVPVNSNKVKAAPTRKIQSMKDLV